MPEPFLPDKRDFDPKDPNPCSGCSNCCEYIALEIDTPTTVNDFDQIRWFLIHKDVWIYIDEENEWHIQFNTPCEKLENRRCSIYEERPFICRDYKADECARYGDGEMEKFLFKSGDDLMQHLETRRPKMYAKLRAKICAPVLNS